MSVWVPRALIVLITAGVAYSIYSISVGDGGPQPVDIEGRVEVQRTIAGIQQDGARLGDENAPVEIELFTDIRSIPGAAFQAEVIGPIIDEYVREGRAEIALRHFSLGRSGVTEAAIAASVAGEQGHQWQFAELVMRNLTQAGPQGVVEDFLKDIAELTPGLEIDEWEADFEAELEAQGEDPSYESAVDTDGELAFDLRLSGEPAVIVTGVGGSETLEDTPTLDDVREAIERVEAEPAL